MLMLPSSQYEKSDDVHEIKHCLASDYFNKSNIKTVFQIQGNGL